MENLENIEVPSPAVAGSPHNTPWGVRTFQLMLKKWESPLRGSFLDSDLQVSSPSRCGRVAGRVPWEGVGEEWGGERVDGSVGVSSAGLFPGFGPPGELTLSGWVEAGVIRKISQCLSPGSLHNTPLH